MEDLVAPTSTAATRRTAPPTFSVLIAAYEAADTVAEAVRSALEQDPAPLEVIVCDDGSTQDLFEPLAPYEGRVTLLRRPHGGEAAAKNAAAAAASGEYLVFLDADDIYLPGRLAALGTAAMERPDLDILTTDADLVAGGRTVRRCYHADHRFAVEDQPIAILRSNFVFGHAAVRRDRYQSVGGFDETISHTADWDCWLRLILQGSRAGLVARPLSQYRLHVGAMSASRARMARGRLQTLSKAERRNDLTPEQHAVVHESIRRQRSVLARAELDDALRSGRPVRRHALHLASQPGASTATRVRAGLVGLAPGLARRRQARLKGTAVDTVGGIRLEVTPIRSDHPAGSD